MILVGVPRRRSLPVSVSCSRRQIGPQKTQGNLGGPEIASKPHRSIALTMRVSGQLHFCPKLHLSGQQLLWFFRRPWLFLLKKCLAFSDAGGVVNFRFRDVDAPSSPNREHGSIRVCGHRVPPPISASGLSVSTPGLGGRATGRPDLSAWL